MDVIDRYMSVVRTFLPAKQQDDIIKELTENIRSQMDDRAIELGRPLTEVEQEAILQQLGHPIAVAGRYQLHQGSLVFGRQLIGTALFPFYLRVLGFNLGITSAIYLIALSVLAVTGNPITFGGMLNAVFLQVFLQFAIVTAIFAAVERSLPAIRWNRHQQPLRHPAKNATWLVPRTESIAQIIALVIFLVWLRAAFNNPLWFLGPAADTYQLGPVWQQVAWPTVLIFAIFFVQAGVNLVRPDRVRWQRWTRLVSDVIGLAIVIFLVRADHWIVLATPNANNTALGAINTDIAYSLWIVLAVAIVITIVDGWRLIRGTPRPLNVDVPHR